MTSKDEFIDVYILHNYRDLYYKTSINDTNFISYNIDFTSACDFLMSKKPMYVYRKDAQDNFFLILENYILDFDKVYFGLHIKEAWGGLSNIGLNTSRNNSKISMDVGNPSIP